MIHLGIDNNYGTLNSYINYSIANQREIAIDNVIEDLINQIRCGEDILREGNIQRTLNKYNLSFAELTTKEIDYINKEINK